MEILCALEAHTSRQSVPDYISNTLRYLSEHIEENPTVAELAALCNISEVYFRKQFKCHMGMTPLEYRNALRLGRARSYLEYGDISVQEISDMIGYSNVSHFIKEFKRQYGSSPLKYRKLIRMDPE
ncbi:MAG: helix-turn-helix transcriptional regulator [Clostridia bacterium]|nr:helix-turn-helix transcriptional regulator [Clostridia bacterium]